MEVKPKFEAESAVFQEVMTLFCLYILCGIFLLMFFISLIRIGIELNIGEEITADLTIGPLQFRAFRKTKTSPLRKRRGKITNDHSKKVSKVKEDRIPKPTISEVIDGIKTLKSPLKKALRKLCQRIRIYPLRFFIILPGQPNPAQTAQDYAKYSALIWALMPILEQIFNVPDAHIHLEPDFSTENFKLEGETKISLRIGTLLAVGVGLSVPAFRWYLQFCKNAKQRTVAKQDAEKKQHNAQSEQAA